MRAARRTHRPSDPTPRAAARLRTASAVLAWTLVAIAAPAAGQEVRWKSDVLFYGDNTEFFTPYRVGETILGAWVKTALEVRTGEHTDLRAGVYGNRRDGSGGPSEVKPILTFRYRTAGTEWRIGTLDPVERRGYLEPLEVTTLELTRPVEYGLEWIGTRPGFRADVYLDWQEVNNRASREIFDYGVLVRGDVTRSLSLALQTHGLHHGGQLDDVGPVTNNEVVAAGVIVHGPLPLAGESSFAAYGLRSTGKTDPFSDGPTIKGGGTYLRGSVSPGGAVEVFGIWWKGRDFISSEGDHNYGSVGSDPSYYRSDRRYQELGVVKKFVVDSNIQVDLEARLHRIDGTVEYSYRFVTRVPLDFKVH